LITLLTPVIALLAGHWFNGESVQTEVWLGTLLIMLGLLGFEFSHRWRELNLRVIRAVVTRK
jgi:drug/metabolite transporter (DMT)-like permease